MSTPLENKDSPALKSKLQKLGFEQVEFEPKARNRFIVYIDNFPSYVIKGVVLPDLRNDGWGILRLDCYNPLGSQLEQLAVDLVRQAEIKIAVKLLTPVGDVDTTWNIIAVNGEIDFGSVNWSNDGEPHLIHIRFKVKEATISY